MRGFVIGIGAGLLVGILLAVLSPLDFTGYVPNAISGGATLPLERVQLPPGFSISLFSRIPGARSLARSPEGTIFVGTRAEGKVYALRDLDGDGVAEKRYVIADGLDTPNGVAVRNGSLYVAEITRILRYDDIEDRLAFPPEPVVVYDGLPDEAVHGWKFIRFGPDGLLYIPVGAPCNSCRSQDVRFASILRLDVETAGAEPALFATGIRNTVGFDWRPGTNELWFTDNGRDLLGDDEPEDELNVATHDGMHFGFPVCHAGNILDPESGRGQSCATYSPPVALLGPHVAALGLRFSSGTQLPESYRGGVFIAEHGSWNRAEPIGYRVAYVPIAADGTAGTPQVFAEGWLGDDGAWGRPVDVEFLPDGSMLLSDDKAGAVYRITYADAS